MVQPDQLGMEDGGTKISSLLRVARQELSYVTSLAKLNAVRELLGTSMSPDDLRGTEKEEWDLLMNLIKTKLAEFGVGRDDGQILIGQPREDDTLVSIQIRAARLSLVTATREEIDQAKNTLRDSISPDGLRGVEKEEWDSLLAAIEVRMNEIAQG